ncbi:MAG: glycosyltransferase family 4 protein [Candidatus Erginobacter occultus]|nr:glycosyltransferase family 4 protein [Candidatus Erginobacter occultus]
MKIAFCIENYLTSRVGAEQYVNDLSRRLSAGSHEVHILTMSSGEDHRDGLRIHILKCGPLPRFLKTLCFAVRCRKAVRGQGFDIVHSFGRTWGMDVFQPLGGSQIAGLIGNIRSIDSLPRWVIKILTYIFSFRRIIYFYVERVQMKEAEVVIAISAMVKGDLLRYCRLRENKVRIVRNGVDLNRFHPRNRENSREQTRRNLGLAAADVMVIFLAHNFRLKGLQTLIGAMAEMDKSRPGHPFKVVVLGAGKEKQFAALARKLRVADKFLFIGCEEDTPRFYAAADISVHPSYYDPSALVVLEAMASGLPVITTAYCGTSEIIQEGQEGYIVPTPSDTVLLADRIRRLGDRELRRRMGEAARRRAEEFPYSRNMQEVLDIYDQYIGSCGG